MIPKIIHYVWLGKGEKNERIKQCIDSWKKYLPDYEIKEWNEDNFNINYNEFTKKSYESKKYAFTSDVARLWALYNYGGIYMDTDVEVYKPLDEFLNEKGFTGFEAINYPVCATMGAEKGNPIIKMFLDYYDCVDFVEYENWNDYINYQKTNTCIMSNLLGILGIDRCKDVKQSIKYFTIYPRSYFLTKDEGWTYHSFNGSW